MVLFTIQPIEVLETIKATGHFSATFSRCTEGEDFADQRYAYQWLANRMNEKIGKGKTEFPIWAWFRRDNDYRRVNTPGETYVKLELDIDPSRVVLSSFDAWCCAMLNCPIIDTDDEKAYDKAFDEITKKGQSAIEETWERVFDIADGDWVQATFWELRVEDIISTEIFVATSPEDSDEYELDN